MNIKKNIESDRLNLLEKLYIPEIVKGMASTFGAMFKPKFTLSYPEEKITPSPSFRGRPVLVKEGETERCVACGLCARVCPALAIEVRAAETEVFEKERYPEVFEINMLRCIFCGFCEEVCPEEAIVMSEDYELVFTSQKDAILPKEKLLVPVEKLQNRLDWLKENK